MDYQYATLSNGIRVIHKQAKSPVAHCGVVIDAGSRDEKPDENGIAHFIEHVIFKGTTHRKAYHIISRLENVGGDLNAYTSKEETFIYASFLKQYYHRTLELIADILFNSTFPEKEIEKEKEVVLDEINSYKDSPSELIFDEFEELLFANYPIGACILGKPERVKTFTRDDIRSFMQRNYLTGRMVISSVGDITLDKLLPLIQKCFGDVANIPGQNGRHAPTAYFPVKRTDKKSNFQVHSVLGNRAYDIKNEKKTALALLTNILGGPGMNSRLNLGIREKYGYCYNVEAHYQPYSDTGDFNIYLGTDSGYIDKSLKLVDKELKKLREVKLGTLQLHQAKQQIKGQMAISLESNLNEMTSIGKSHLFFEKVDTMTDILAKVEKISASELMEVANEIFVPDSFTILTYLPKNED